MIPLFREYSTYSYVNSVSNKALQANELAILSNIGVINEDVHTYVLLAWVDLAPEKVLFARTRLNAPYKGTPSGGQKMMTDGSVQTTTFDIPQVRVYTDGPTIPTYFLVVAD